MPPGSSRCSSRRDGRHEQQAGCGVERASWDVRGGGLATGLLPWDYATLVSGVVPFFFFLRDCFGLTSP